MLGNSNGLEVTGWREPTSLAWAGKSANYHFYERRGDGGAKLPSMGRKLSLQGKFKGATRRVGPGVADRR